MKISHYEASTAIREILLADPSIVEVLGDKIFPLIADEGTDGDYVTLQRDGFMQGVTKMGIARRDPYVYVSVVSADSQRSQDIAKLISEAVEGEFADPDMEIRLEDDTEEYEAGKYIQVMKFLVIL